MRRLGDTIARLSAKMPMSMPMPVGETAPNHRLRPLTGFGSNPGALAGWYFVPEERVNMPLVVVLHGCTQTAAGYDNGSGWSEMAERHGFAVLFPEQTRANNPNLCFNWFSPVDTRRDSGEALSIREMIAEVVRLNAIDPRRIYVTGLSAGGAMTSVMLASYPELFAGGAIIAGLPYGAAATVPQALERMRGEGHVLPEDYGRLVRRASAHKGPWPKISVWHGGADPTVAPGNADAVVGQWLDVLGLSTKPDRTESVGDVRRQLWLDHEGGVLVEDYRIPGMGHGTPLGTEGPTASGQAGPHMLDVGLSSTWLIAEGWGLIDPAAPARVTPERAAAPSATAASHAQPSAPHGVQETIAAALRSAGLMR